MDALVNFYTDQSFLDWYKTTLDERHSWHFPKRNCCGHDDLSILGIPLHTIILCQYL